MVKNRTSVGRVCSSGEFSESMVNTENHATEFNQQQQTQKVKELLFKRLVVWVDVLSVSYSIICFSCPVTMLKFESQNVHIVVLDL